MAVLLNSADGTLHIANLMFPTGGVDLNTVTADASSAEATAEASSNAEFAPLAQVMGTFYVIEPINLSPTSMPATATPMPTAAPTAEATSEATEAVDDEPTAEATDASADETPEATVEATDEA